jgi:hypothetical protein
MKVDHGKVFIYAFPPRKARKLTGDMVVSENGSTGISLVLWSQKSVCA